MTEQAIIAACEALLLLKRLIGRPITVPDVKPLTRAFYALPGNGAGGSLHVVLDDGNREDSSVDFCIEYAEKAGDLAGAALGKVLRTMSRTQRGKV